MYHPYNWNMWDGSKFNFDSVLKIPSGYVQDPISLSCIPNSLKAINSSYATVTLKATGGLQRGYHHENNYGIAPFAFAWSETPNPPNFFESTISYTYNGTVFKFNALDWFLAGEIKNGEATASNILNVNEAIDRMLSAADMYGIQEAADNLVKLSEIYLDSTPYFKKQNATKEYVASKRLQLGKSYYFHAVRFGGKNLFAESGFHASTNFLPTAITSTSEPIKMG